MFKPFEAQEGRLRLLNLLKENGYGVRMHAYEYFVRGKYFIAFIHLMPSRNLAVIMGFKWNLKEFERSVKRILSLVKQVDPSVDVDVHLY